MDLTRLLVQVLIALACGTVATLLIPRQIPGKLLGLVLIGFAGVWLGEWSVSFLTSTYDLSLPDFLSFDFQGVLVIPAIIGSAIILYIVTTFLSWGRYRR
ncbi:hypothetical protein PN498_22620 [Oscillatoria sp. CS-180]|uniref:hypothetical protein n=1 Tax=Oscillatoria sp. CS-180 TaxID=3021720 RepID=UPI00232B064E|nr:hypothetical protein [Oscillatoria sp. CS-180]MDB9528804.1 hypothetical protein [Oscillatoria sp. CS-180]